jgi:hypothetical protein
MQLWPGLVLHKTGKGQAELRQRTHGLPPRVRQVLILADGRRNVQELARIVPEQELLASLKLLEAEGFVARNALDAAIAALASPDGGASADELVAALRQGLVQALLDEVGASGDALAARLGRCATIDELRELLPAATLVVEAVRGPDASARFAARLGRL